MDGSLSAMMAALVALLTTPHAAGTDDVLRAVSVWGVPALGVLVLASAAGVPIPVEIALVALGALSGRAGGPDFAVMLVVGTVAAVAGDVFDYALGRFGVARLWRWLMRKRERMGTDRALAVSARLLRRRGMAVLLTRFLLTPLSTPVSILAGASRYGFTAFLLWDAAGEAIYVGGNLALGRFFGTRLLATPWGAPVLLGVVAVLSLAPVLLVRWVAMRSRPRVHRETRDLDRAA